MFQLEIPHGEYSCMVEAGDIKCGGVGFDFPLVESIYENSNLTLVMTKFYTTNAAVENTDDFKLNLVAPGKCEIIPGENYLDTTITSGKSYVVAPAIVWAFGNAILYNYSIELSDELSKNYGVTPVVNATFGSSISSIQKKTFSLTTLKNFELTAPTDADTEFYYQINNFNDKKIEEKSISKEELEGGNTKYTVRYPSFSNVTYRVTQKGKVTAAGYAKDNAAYTVEPRDGDPASTDTSIESKAGAGSNIEYESSVLLNIDDKKKRNELAMKEGETFRLRAYRAAWEIVNTVTANIMIEPDFNYEVIEGDDVVSLSPVENLCTGNAKDNWVDIKAKKSGKAVVAVWYDAIDVGGNTTLKGTYGATDKARYGIFVINVGKDENIQWNPVSSDGDWDAEFDTVFYTGKEGTFTFEPDDSVKKVTVTNIYGKEKSSEVTVNRNKYGEYKVPVKSGANIIAAETAEGTDYSVVRAKKITCPAVNNTTGEKANSIEDLDINKGDSITVNFDQLNMPLPKMSGVYNPGYGGTAKTTYKFNDKYTLTSVGTQYDYITEKKSQITFDAEVEGKNILSAGYIASGSMGDQPGNHRNMGEGGRGTNFNAVNVNGNYGSLPEMEFFVEGSKGEVDYNKMVKLKKLVIYAGTTAYNTGFKYNGTNATNIKDQVAQSWTNAADSYYLSVQATPETYYNKLQFRYWYEGESPKTVDIEGGVEKKITEGFTADKTRILNMEVIVTPGDESAGAPKVYRYVVYPGNTALKYEHPIISSLKFTGEGGELKLDKNVNYTDLEYTLGTEGATDVSLAAEMFQRSKSATNMTADKSDKVELQKYNGSEKVGDSITLQEGGSYPVGSFTYDNLDLSGCDKLEIKVTSYANENTSRTYTVNVKEHNTVHHRAKAPTCLAGGNCEYWYCKSCDKYFTDEACTNQIDEKDCKLEAKGHSMKKYEAKEPSCTDDGNRTYYRCKACEKLFEDKNGENRTVRSAVILPATGHSYGEWTEIKSPNCVDKGSRMRECTECDFVQHEEMNETGHRWADEFTVDKKATLKHDGSKSVHCVNEDCEARRYSTVIPRIHKIVLSKEVATYTGKVIKPSVKATDAEGKIIRTIDLKYDKDLKKVGLKKVKVIFKGEYEGRGQLSYIIKPAKGEFTDVKVGKKKLTVKIASQKASGISGYELKYKRAGYNWKTKRLSTKDTKVVLKRLKTNKYYKVKVRSYTKVNGKRIYGEYSEIYKKKVR